jgi:hypothetical protein
MALPYFTGFIGGTGDTEENEGGLTLLAASWTQEVRTLGSEATRLRPVGQAIYAKASLYNWDSVGEFAASRCGIVEYTKGTGFGPPETNLVGENFPGGVAPYIQDSNVESVTFGWYMESAMNGYFGVYFNLEIWA